MDYQTIISEMDKLSSELCDFHNASDTIPVECKDWFLRCMFSHFKRTFETLADQIDSDFIESIEIEVGKEFRDKYKIGIQLESQKEKLLVG